MTHWARQARNKALGDKRKAAKQGAQIVAWMRRNNGTDGIGEDETQKPKVVEGTEGQEDSGSQGEAP